MRFYKFSGILILLFAFTMQTFALHRYHTSLTRIDYNAKDKNIEISIELFTHDLVPLLEKRLKKSVELENSPAADKAIFDYLNENFVLKNKAGETLALKWVGKETDVDTALIYVETASDEDLEGFSLQNTLFFESFPEQTNLVTAHYSEKQADLLFKVGDKIKELRSEK